MRERPQRQMRAPSEIFQQKILPAYHEYLAHPAAMGLANILAVAINDHLEWTFEYHKAGDVSRLHGASSLQQFRDVIYGLCPNLGMMKDLADADKHRELRPDPRRKLFLSTHAYARGEGGLWVSGYEKPFKPAADAAVRFWKEWSD